MHFKMARGILRLVASIVLCIILLPYILRLYLAIAPGATAREILTALVQTVPFGDYIELFMLAIWGKAQSGVDSLLDWILSQEYGFEMNFSMEFAALVFTSAFAMAISGIVGNSLVSDTNDGLFNQLANCIFQVLVTFCASLGADWSYRLFSSQLLELTEAGQIIVGIVYVVLLTGGGLWMIVLCGVVFLDALLIIGIGCLKLCINYGFFILLLIIEIQGSVQWLVYISTLIWLFFLWLLLRAEKLFLPKK